MEGSCSTGQSPQWAVVPVGEEQHYVINVGLKPLLMRMLGDVQYKDSN
jgi:hypothetical protein